VVQNDHFGSKGAKRPSSKNSEMANRLKMIKNSILSFSILEPVMGGAFVSRNTHSPYRMKFNMDVAFKASFD